MFKTTRPKICSVPLFLTWSTNGATYRVTAWPEVQLECRYGTEWVSVALTAEISAQAGKSISAGAWRAYLEFAPLAVREFVGYFRANRLTALQVAARCPELVGVLSETPALTPFVAAHATLRGSESARWGELNAVFERGGLYGVLEWLGLPASHQTVSVLRNVVAADLPPALLAPLRTVLWHPRGVFALAQMPVITPRDLDEAVNVLAA